MTRPQPVVGAAKVAATVNGIVTTLAGLAVVLGVVTQTDADTVANALVGLCSAVVTVVTVVAPLVKAGHAAKQVTPLSDPRDAWGSPLVSAPQD